MTFRGLTPLGTQTQLHHQKLIISSTDWSVQSQHQVSVKWADHFCSNSAHRNDRQNVRTTDRQVKEVRLDRQNVRTTDRQVKEVRLRLRSALANDTR